MPKDSAISELDELHRQARTARARLEPSWYLSLAYYSNEQWMAWDGRQLYRPQLRRNRITVTNNRVTGAVEKNVARMTKQRPVFVATPRTADEEDANAARVAEQIMRYLWQHLHLHELTMKALRWSQITGAGFLKVYWDDSIGDSIEVLVRSDGTPLTDAQGAPVRGGSPEAALALSMGSGQVRVKRVSQGDLRVEARSPFQMFVDPLADTFTEAEWVIEESVKSREYVQRRYGTDIEPDTPASPGLIEARMGNVFLPGTGGYKGVKVREYWCKPNSTHPEGRRVVWAAKQILEVDDHPFDPIPYVMLSGIPLPGRLWPMSLVDLLRGPQTELNKLSSQIAENRNRVGNPTIVASKQAVQDPDKFADATTMPGGIYFFDDVGSPNSVPQYLQAPPLPNYVIEEYQRIEDSIAEISGQHEVTSAQVPPGVTAASAINLLQEADDTRLGPAIADYEVQLGRLGQKCLNLVANFYTDARTIRLAGENGSWEIFDFRGSMLRDNTSVQVQTGSAFPQSKAAKQAALQDLLTFFVQSGNPPHGRALGQFLRDFDMGGAERLIEDYTRNEEQVNRENSLLAQGVPLQINSFDDDQAHIDGHEDEQKSARYARFPPQVKQVFEQHVLAHRQRLADQQQQMIQQQMQMQGQSPEQMAQQQAMQQAQQQQQMTLKDAQQAQQQGYSAASSEQEQRQSEELHQQKLRHQEEAHQQRLRQQAQQAQQQPRKAA